MKLTRFEELEVWQKARELAHVVYQLTAHGQFSRDYGLRDQMRRAGVSIMANIVEGFSRKSNKEFSQFLFIAKSIRLSMFPFEPFRGVYGKKKENSQVIECVTNQ